LASPMFTRRVEQRIEEACARRARIGLIGFQVERDDPAGLARQIPVTSP
jgi:hypothetical protein